MQSYRGGIIVQYTDILDNYSIDVFNGNFRELHSKDVQTETKLDSEIDRAKAAEARNAGNISLESARAAQRESEIETNLAKARDDLTAAINAARKALTDYTDSRVANIINGAPETLDTFKEIADAIQANSGVMDTLNNAIGQKAQKSDLTAHTGNNTIHITDEERTKYNDAANPQFETADTRTNIASGETPSTLFGKIKKYFADLKAVAFSGSYNDLSDRPTIPSKLSQLTNDAGFTHIADGNYVRCGTGQYSSLADFWTAANNLIKINSGQIAVMRFKDTGGFTPSKTWWKAIVSSQNLVGNGKYGVGGSVILFNTDPSVYLGYIGGGATDVSDISATWHKIDVSTIVLSGTLAKGTASLAFTDSAISTTALIDIYTDIYGLAPKAATVSGNTLTLTFEAQSKAVAVKVKVRN